MSMNRRNALLAVATVPLAVRMPAKGTGWQPIETAPRDGTKVFLWFKDQAHIGHWEDWYTERTGTEKFYKYGKLVSENQFTSHRYQRWYLFTSHELNPNPTYWMPIPQPPAPESA